MHLFFWQLRQTSRRWSISCSQRRSFRFVSGDESRYTLIFVFGSTDLGSKSGDLNGINYAKYSNSRLFPFCRQQWIQHLSSFLFFLKWKVEKLVFLCILNKITFSPSLIWFTFWIQLASLEPVRNHIWFQQTCYSTHSC